MCIDFILTYIHKKEEVKVQRVKLNVLSTVTEQNPDESLVYDSFHNAATLA